ncbi:CCAAT enhancer binding protein beta/delta/epsilon homolog [Ciona intestinalis]
MNNQNGTGTPSGSGNQDTDVNFGDPGQTAEPLIKFKYPQTPQTVPVVQNFGGKAPPPSKAMVKGELEGDPDDYVKRRQRNNIAVKKSREKSREKSQVTSERIDQLKEENCVLENKVEVLNQELKVLKQVFMDHAKGFSGSGIDLPDLEQLEKLLGHKLTDKPGTSQMHDNKTNGPSCSGSKS